MPLTYEVIDDGRGIVWIASGDMIGDELVATFKDAWAGVHSAKSVVYVFQDFGAITDWHISTDHFRELAAMRTAAHERLNVERVIVTLASLEFTFHLVEMWQSLAELPKWETKVFRKRLEAIAWLRKRVAERFGFQISLV